MYRYWNTDVWSNVRIAKLSDNIFVVGADDPIKVAAQGNRLVIKNEAKKS
jgi:hypothetical protein